MRPIAIVPRPGHEIRIELDHSVAYLNNAGIEVRNMAIGQGLALVWVDDEIVSISVEALRGAGFNATELTETDASQ
jgi:hypothetical protein